MKNAIRAGAVLLLICGAFYGCYRHNYPYGSTHRCSKCFAPFLEEYADAHGGNYPQAERPDQLGMDELLKDCPDSFDMVFGMIVGKAGNLRRARRFYDRHGYLKAEHSSWHYVPGLTTDDVGRALAWDKIPLTHNGMRVSYNPREVIMVGGMVRQVIEDRWEEFLNGQRELAEETCGAEQ